MKKAVLIIPTYNEAEVIEETITKLFQETDNIPNIALHILIFDSASADQTQEIVLDLKTIYERLHLKVELHKSGLGSAYMQAMRFALDVMDADIIIEFDADLSHQPKYLKPMLNKMETHDVVIGSRYVRGGSIPQHWGWDRKLLSVLGNLIVRVFLSPKYKDWTSGFRITNKSMLTKALPRQFFSQDYAYKLHLFWALHNNKARILEFPIEFFDRQKGQSKLPSNSIFDSLKVLFLLRAPQFSNYIKMCLVGFSGMILQFFIFNILRHYVSSISAFQIGMVVAICTNFILNNNFTFKKRSLRGTRKFKILGYFAVYSIGMVFLQRHWFQLMINFIGYGVLKENLIVFTGMVTASFINYFSYSSLIWTKKMPKPATLY